MDNKFSPVPIPDEPVPTIEHGAFRKAIEDVLGSTLARKVFDAHLENDLVATTQKDLANVLANEIYSCAESFAKKRSTDVVNSITVNEELSEDQRGNLIRSFPGLHIRFSSSTNTNSHAFAAAHRKCENLHLLSKTNYIPQTTSVKGIKNYDDYVCDVGGNYLFYMHKSFHSIHSCCPILDIRDQNRYVEKKTSLASALANSYLGMSDWTKEKAQMMNDCLNLAGEVDFTNDLACSNKAQDCSRKALYLLAVHSLYDISLKELNDIFNKKNANVMYASMMFDPRICLGANEGYIEGVQAHYRIDRKKDEITFTFKNDSSHSYVHKYSSYLMYFIYTTYRAPDGSGYDIELLENINGVQFIKFVRLRFKHPPSVSPRRSLWFNAFENTTLLTLSQCNLDSLFEYAKDNSLLPEGALNCSSHDVYEWKKENRMMLSAIVPTHFYDKMCEYAVGATEQKFKPSELFNYGRTARSVIIIDKYTVNVNHDKISFMAMWMTSIVVYVKTYENKYNLGKLVQGALQGVSADRELAKKGLWGKITHSRHDYQLAETGNFFTRNLHKSLYASRKSVFLDDVHAVKTPVAFSPNTTEGATFLRCLFVRTEKLLYEVDVPVFGGEELVQTMKNVITQYNKQVGNTQQISFPEQLLEEIAEEKGKTVKLSQAPEEETVVEDEFLRHKQKRILRVQNYLHSLEKKMDRALHVKCRGKMVGVLLVPPGPYAEKLVQMHPSLFVDAEKLSGFTYDPLYFVSDVPYGQDPVDDKFFKSFKEKWNDTPLVNRCSKILLTDNLVVCRGNPYFKCIGAVYPEDYVKNLGDAKEFASSYNARYTRMVRNSHRVPTTRTSSDKQAYEEILSIAATYRKDHPCRFVSPGSDLVLYDLLDKKIKQMEDDKPDLFRNQMLKILRRKYKDKYDAQRCLTDGSPLYDCDQIKHILEPHYKHDKKSVEALRKYVDGDDTPRGLEGSFTRFAKGFVQFWVDSFTTFSYADAFMPEEEEDSEPDAVEAQEWDMREERIEREAQLENETTERNENFEREKHAEEERERDKRNERAEEVKQSEMATQTESPETQNDEDETATSKKNKKAMKKWYTELSFHVEKAKKVLAEFSGPRLKRRSPRAFEDKKENRRTMKKNQRKPEKRVEPTAKQFDKKSDHPKRGPPVKAYLRPGAFKHKQIRGALSNLDQRLVTILKNSLVNEIAETAKKPEKTPPVADASTDSGEDVNRKTKKKRKKAKKRVEIEKTEGSGSSGFETCEDNEKGSNETLSHVEEIRSMLDLCHAKKLKNKIRQPLVPLRQYTRAGVKFLEMVYTESLDLRGLGMDLSCAPGGVQALLTELQNNGLEMEWDAFNYTGPGALKWTIGKGGCREEYVGVAYPDLKTSYDWIYADGACENSYKDHSIFRAAMEFVRKNLKMRGWALVKHGDYNEVRKSLEPYLNIFHIKFLKTSSSLFTNSEVYVLLTYGKGIEDYSPPLEKLRKFIKEGSADVDAPDEVRFNIMKNTIVQKDYMTFQTIGDGLCGYAAFYQNNDVAAMNRIKSCIRDAILSSISGYSAKATASAARLGGIIDGDSLEVLAECYNVRTRISMKGKDFSLVFPPNVRDFMTKTLDLSLTAPEDDGVGHYEMASNHAHVNNIPDLAYNLTSDYSRAAPLPPIDTIFQTMDNTTFGKFAKEHGEGIQHIYFEPGKNACCLDQTCSNGYLYRNYMAALSRVPKNLRDQYDYWTVLDAKRFSYGSCEMLRKANDVHFIDTLALRATPYFLIRIRPGHTSDGDASTRALMALIDHKKKCSCSRVTSLGSQFERLAGDRYSLFECSKIKGNFDVPEAEKDVELYKEEKGKDRDIVKLHFLKPPNAVQEGKVVVANRDIFVYVTISPGVGKIPGRTIQDVSAQRLTMKGHQVVVCGTQEQAGQLKKWLFKYFSRVTYQVPREYGAAFRSDAREAIKKNIANLQRTKMTYSKPILPPTYRTSSHKSSRDYNAATEYAYYVKRQCYNSFNQISSLYETAKNWYNGDKQSVMAITDKYFGLYNVRKKVWVHYPEIPPSPNCHACCYDGKAFRVMKEMSEDQDTPPFPSEKQMLPVEYVDVQSDFVAFNRDTVLMNYFVMDKVFETMADQLEKSTPDFNVKYVDGVAGCGKTDLAFKCHSVRRGMILCTGRETTAQLQKRALDSVEIPEGIDRNAYVKERFRTVDSVLINGVPNGVTVDRLVIDEALMNHYGAVVWLAMRTGANEVVAIGDRAQIPFVSRLEGFDMQYGAFDTRSPMTRMNTSRTMPADVALMLKKNGIYKEIRTNNPKITSMKVARNYSSGAIAAYSTQGYKILTFTQNDKITCQNAVDGLRFKQNDPISLECSVVNTVHEVQGSRYENVCLVRIEPKPLAIYKSEPHMLVGVTRHTNKFQYITAGGAPQDDPLSGWIASVSGKESEAKTLVTSVAETQSTQFLDPTNDTTAEASLLKNTYPKFRKMMEIKNKSFPDLEVYVPRDVAQIKERVNTVRKKSYCIDPDGSWREKPGMDAEGVVCVDELREVPEDAAAILVRRADYTSDYWHLTDNFPEGCMLIIAHPFHPTANCPGRIQAILAKLSGFAFPPYYTVNPSPDGFWVCHMLSPAKSMKVMYSTFEKTRAVAVEALSQNLERLLASELAGAGLYARGVKQFPDYYVEIENPHPVDNLKLRKDLREKLEENGFISTQPLRTNMVPMATFAPDIPFAPVGYCDQVYMLQEFVDSVYPGQSSMCIPYIHDMYELSDQKISLGEAKFSHRPEYQFETRPTLRSVLHTACPIPVPKSQKQLMKAFAERNGNVPNLTGSVEEEQLAQTVYEKFVQTYLSDDETSLNALRMFAENPVAPNVTDIEQWLKDQPPAVMKQIFGEKYLLVEKDLRQYTLSLKRLSKIVLDSDITNKYASPQTIAYQEKLVNMIFSPLVKEMKRRLLSVLKKNFLINCDVSSEDFEKIFSARFPPAKLREYIHRLELDMSKYDKSQNRLTQMIERKILLLLGFPKELLDLWDWAHTVSEMRNYYHKFSAKTFFQRKSGDAMTFFGNTLYLMAMMAYMYDLSDAFALFSGDDSYVFSKKHLGDATNDAHRFAIVFNMQAKLLNYAYPYFCSKFLIPITDHNWLFVPDLLKVAIKLGRNDLVDWEHAEEYRVSLADNMKQYSNACMTQILGKAMRDRYGCTPEIDPFCAVVNHLVSSKENFQKLYYLPDNTTLLLKNERPTLDI